MEGTVLLAETITDECAQSAAAAGGFEF